MPITTVSDCKAFRKIEAENTDHDEGLERLITAVQQWLEQECRRTFDQASVTEYFHGHDWRDCIMVSRPPIVSITNLWDDLARAYTTPISASQYVIEDAEAGIVRLDGLTFQKGLRNIKITYLGGYQVMPPDLEQAAIEMIWAAYAKGDQNLIGVRSRSIADGSVQFVNLSWPLDLDAIISKYRLNTGVA